MFTVGSAMRCRVAGAGRWCIGLALACASSLALVACGGGGSEPAAAPLEGRVTFDYVPNQQGRLTYTATQARPVRGAPVEVIDSSGSVLARTRTDADGRYRVAVSLASTGDVRLRVTAQLEAAGAAAVQVADNTQGDAVYALESPAFSAADGGRDLHAPSGWTGQGYGKPRSAAPFAILDTLYRSQASVRAAQSDAALPALTVLWSPANKPTQGMLSLGEIGTTFFTATARGARIYVLGFENVDTDEYDESVIAHEWGHYYQWAFSRDDSPGGPHAGEPLEMTLAFSEGWGNAWSGIATSRSDYADSNGDKQGNGWALPLAQATTALPGWFDEDSISTVLWQLAREHGVAPVHQAMRVMADLPAFTSIFSFSHALRSVHPQVADTLDGLLAGQGIVASSVSADPYGSLQTLSAGLANYLGGQAYEWLVLPVYLPVPVDGSPASLCTANGDISPSFLLVRRFLRVEVQEAGGYRLTITAGPDTSNAVPAAPVLTQLLGRQKTPYLFGVGTGPWTQQLSLPRGTHVFDLVDDSVLAGQRLASCFTIAATRTP